MLKTIEEEQSVDFVALILFQSSNMDFNSSRKFGKYSAILDISNICQSGWLILKMDSNLLC